MTLTSQLCFGPFMTQSGFLQENLTQEEREERRRAAEMETAVRLQREREEAEAARAEQLRKEVRGPAMPKHSHLRVMGG